MRLIAEYRLSCESPAEASKKKRAAEMRLGRARFEAARRAIHGDTTEGEASAGRGR